MLLLDVFVSPTQVFKHSKHTKNWSWLALSILCTFLFCSEIAFYRGMSVDWILSQQMQNVVKESNSIESIGLVSGFTVVVFQLSLVIYLSGYYYINSLVHSIKSEYQEWLSFSVWIFMPILIQTIGFIMLFMTSKTSNLPLPLSQYASLNYLFLDFPRDHKLYDLASSFSVFYIWSISLSTLGLGQLCNFSTLKSLFVSTLPFIVLYGLWYLFS